MKPVNLAAQLAAVETELTCLKMVLAQAREDRDGLRQERDELRRERDAWRRVAEKLNACALREAEAAPRLPGAQLMAAPPRGRLGAKLEAIVEPGGRGGGDWSALRRARRSASP